MVPDGKLCSEDKNCFACQVRTNRSDLVEVDSDDLVNAIQSAPSDNPWDENKRNPLYGNKNVSNQQILDSVNNSNLPSFLKGMVQNAMQVGLNQMCPEPIPVIHSLDELELPGTLKAKWVKSENEFDSFISSKTLEIKWEDGCEGVMTLLFAIFWLAITIPVLGMAVVSFLSDPSSTTVNGHPGSMNDVWLILLFPVLFWGVGIFLAYHGIKSCFYKVWMDITPECIYFERGFFRGGKKIRIERNPQTKVDVHMHTGSKGHRYYSVYISDENNSSFMLKENVSQVEANMIQRMLQIILAAQL